MTLQTLCIIQDLLVKAETEAEMTMDRAQQRLRESRNNDSDAGLETDSEETQAREKIYWHYREEHSKLAAALRELQSQDFR